MFTEFIQVLVKVMPIVRMSTGFLVQGLISQRVLLKPWPHDPLPRAETGSRERRLHKKGVPTIIYGLIDPVFVRVYLHSKTQLNDTLSYSWGVPTVHERSIHFATAEKQDHRDIATDLSDGQVVQLQDSNRQPWEGCQPTNPTNRSSDHTRCPPNHRLGSHEIQWACDA